MNIVIVDYDIGNVRSIINAFKQNNLTPTLSNNLNEIMSADGLILPGVGAFARGMENLAKYNLVNTLRKFAETGKPLLGICLGMQLLLDESEEFGYTKGLGLISGNVIKLPTHDKNYEKLPHVSWNEINKMNIDWDDTILDKINIRADAYFVHSFVADPTNKDEILSTTSYSDYMFCSSLKKGNIYGCQFHPEKSGETGLKIIKNFINLCEK